MSRWLQGDAFSVYDSSVSIEGPTTSGIRCTNILKPDQKSVKSPISAIPEIFVICEIWPKISEIRLENLEIRRKIPEIIEILREIHGIWSETLQVRPEVPKIWPVFHETYCIVNFGFCDLFLQFFVNC